MIQLNFTGASGTGKTTMLNKLHELYPDLKIKTNVVRDLVKEKGIKINEMGNDEGQKVIFDAYDKFLIENKDEEYINDRCVIDPLAYTIVSAAGYQVDRSVLDYQWQRTKGIVDEGLLKVVFYFPIEFACADDGVRSKDEDYRKETDAAFRGIIDGLKDKFGEDKFRVVRVSGSVEERLEIIKKEIEKMR